MRQLILIIWLLAISIVSSDGKVYSQDVAPEGERIIYVDFNVEEDAPLKIYAEFFQARAFYGIIINPRLDIFYNYRVNQPETSPHMNVFLSYNEIQQIEINIELLEPTSLNISSILYSQIGFPLKYDYDVGSIIAEEIVFGMIDWLGYYTLGDCRTRPFETYDNIMDYYVAFYSANCYLLLGEYELAMEQYESILNADIEIPNMIPTINNLAWTYLQLNQLDEAIALIEQLPTTLDALPRRAQLYALAFDYDSAIADMDAAIELAEDNEVSDEQLAELYTIRGEIIFLIYEWDRVLENFNTALDLDPDYAPAYFQRGVLYYTMALREEALADFQHYLELEPDAINAEEAQHYIDSIQTELDTLGG